MIDRNLLLSKYPITDYVAGCGIKVVGNGKEVKCCCPFHDDKSPSLSINTEKNLWHCFVCNIGGTVIDFHARTRSISIKEALIELAEKANIKPDEKPVKAAEYIYKDQFGRPVMKVERIEEGYKKRFVQSRIDESGKSVKGIDGVQRVLFRIEKWIGMEEVNLVEGEKCVAALESLGMDATTNAGGSSAWMDSYAEYLKGKRVNIWPDNDEPGKKWKEKVINSLQGKVSGLRVLQVPQPYNDVADMVISKGTDMAMDTISDMIDSAPLIDKGVDMPLLSSFELYDRYVKQVERSDQDAVDMGRWLPSLKHHSRPLFPGDMVVVLADTGVGKTGILANILYHQRPMPCIFFELELAPEPMCERFIALDNKNITAVQVERHTKMGKSFDVKGWDHIYICPNTHIDIEEMERLTLLSELKIGQKPKIIAVDYIGLMQGGKGSQFERTSMIAEGLKRLARSTNTVVIVASQVRRDADRIEINLHDGKNSSSIEASAQLVLGAWRPEQDKMMIKILKQTKKAGQPIIECNFDGDGQKITEIYHENDRY